MTLAARRLAIKSPFTRNVGIPGWVTRGSGRALWIALGICFACVLVVARMLHPSASGLGTHTQLGLPACAFLALTSLPCPACGLTTAFACMVRGDVAGAVHANAFGALACTLSMLAVPACAWAALRGLAPSETYMHLRLDRCALALAMFAFANWIARVAFLLTA